MPIAVTLELKTQPGKRDDLVAALNGMLPDTRARKGAGKIEMVVDQDDADRILIYEIWETKQDQLDYLGWRKERGDLDALSGFVAEPPVFRYFDIADRHEG